LIRNAYRLKLRVGHAANIQRFAMKILFAAVAMLTTAAITGPARAAEIKVVGSPGFREAYTELLPGFEKTTGNKVTTNWGGVTEVAKRVADGETADIVILPVA
jgi:molybdate transport system substrate-binding protein